MLSLQVMQPYSYLFINMVKLISFSLGLQIDDNFEWDAAYAWL